VHSISRAANPRAQTRKEGRSVEEKRDRLKTHLESLGTLGAEDQCTPSVALLLISSLKTRVREQSAEVFVSTLGLPKQRAATGLCFNFGLALFCCSDMGQSNLFNCRLLWTILSLSYSSLEAHEAERNFQQTPLKTHNTLRGPALVYLSMHNNMSKKYKLFVYLLQSVFHQ